MFLARPIASLPRSRSSARRRASFSLWIAAGALIRIPVQVIARPRRVAGARAIEQYLEELQGARSKRRNRAAQIKPPGAHERLVVHVRDAVAMRLETVEPVLDRQRIMRPQIFHVENTAAQRLEEAPFIGDAWFYRFLSALGQGKTRLLETEAGTALPPPPRR